MKIMVDRIGILGAIGCVFLCGVAVAMELCTKEDIDRYSIIALTIYGIMILASFVAVIILMLQYIKIDDKKIMLYCGKKIKKSVYREDVVKIIIWQYNFHGVKNGLIIVDDGTFNIHEFANKKSRYKKQWIAVEYTNKRLATLRQIFPNCPIETIAPDQY